MFNSKILTSRKTDNDTFNAKHRCIDDKVAALIKYYKRNNSQDMRKPTHLEKRSPNTIHNK